MAKPGAPNEQPEISSTIRVLLVLVIISIWGISIGASQLPATELPNPPQAYLKHRTPPNYSFSIIPGTTITNYHDYFPAAYDNHPFSIIPNAAGGGYFATYQGKRTSTGNRRVFYYYLSPTGTLINHSEITANNRLESSPALSVDYVSGKPFYVWQTNMDYDPEPEVVLTSDAFIEGISGLFNDCQIVIDNPVSITAPDGSISSNVFLNPSIVIGPSPIDDKRRIYVLGRTEESCYLARADFDADDVENGNPLIWTYRSIPELDAWNADATIRRTHYSLVGCYGWNTYYAGWREQDNGDLDIDVFRCDNYGEGPWIRHSMSSVLPSWNPPASPDSTGGYFTNDAGIPYQNSEMKWKLMNSGHLSASFDDEARIHIPGIWGLCNSDGNFYPELQVLKEAVYTTTSQSFEIREIYPKNPFGNTYSPYFQPWDLQAPWGVVDAWNGNASEGWHPEMFSIWPFPHWDDSAHDGTMMFHYNNLKLTRANSQGMMAAVWQDSHRARQSHVYQDPAYAQYASTPEIYISVSEDNGQTWQPPIALNNVDTPQLAGTKPMWVYPADTVIYTGTQNGVKSGKLGLMFYNDYTWGANSISPPYHPNADGGKIMYAELLIEFTIPDPVFSPPAGVYNAPLEVSISYPDPTAGIHYTTDGTVPNIQSPLYTGPIPVNGFLNLKAIAFTSEQNSSEVVSGIYRVELGLITFTPEAGTYYEPLSISLSCNTAGAQIYYSMDGSNPTEDSDLYTEPITISQTTLLRARAYHPQYLPGNPELRSYVLKVHPVDFSLPGGSYDVPIDVSLSCLTPLSEIHYTTNGTDPQIYSPLYEAPLHLESTTLVKARAFRDNWYSSVLSARTFYLPVANSDDTQVPELTQICSAFPNPGAGVQKIELGIKGDLQDYSLRIYNIRGSCVRSFKGRAKGFFSLEWQGNDDHGQALPAAIYFLSLETAAKRSLMKLVRY